MGIAELIDASFGALTAGAAAVVTAPAAFQVRRASEVALRALDLIRARATPEEVEANG